MSLPVRSPLGMSSLERFLFADIGPQSNGLPFTVLSLFARAGLDPWEEAARLSLMSRSAAASRLAAEINRAPSYCRRPIDVGELAKSLITRLPSYDQAKPSTRAMRLEGVPGAVLMMMIFYATLFSLGLLALLLEKS